MRKMIVFLSIVVLGGCVNVDMQLTQPDKSIAPTKTGEDCAVAFLLPILIGTLSIQNAMDKAGHAEPSPRYTDYKFIKTPITRLHSTTLKQFEMPFYREVCIEAKGE